MSLPWSRSFLQSANDVHLVPSLVTSMMWAWILAESSLFASCAARAMTVMQSKAWAAKVSSAPGANALYAAGNDGAPPCGVPEGTVPLIALTEAGLLGSTLDVRLFVCIPSAV